MENFAIHMLEELRITLPAGQALVNIAGATDRYALFKAGPVLSASVSISQKLIKLFCNFQQYLSQFAPFFIIFFGH